MSASPAISLSEAAYVSARHQEAREKKPPINIYASASGTPATLQEINYLGLKESKLRAGDFIAAEDHQTSYYMLLVIDFIVRMRPGPVVTWNEPTKNFQLDWGPHHRIILSIIAPLRGKVSIVDPMIEGKTFAVEDLSEDFTPLSRILQKHLPASMQQRALQKSSSIAVRKDIVYANDGRVRLVEIIEDCRELIANNSLDELNALLEKVSLASNQMRSVQLQAYLRISSVVRDKLPSWDRLREDTEKKIQQEGLNVAAEMIGLRP